MQDSNHFAHLRPPFLSPVFASAMVTSAPEMPAQLSGDTQGLADVVASLPKAIFSASSAVNMWRIRRSWTFGS